MSKTNLPILEQRRIEADIIKSIFEEMVAEFGKTKAEAVLRAAITKDSISQAQAYAESEGGRRDLASFHSLLGQWKANGALEIEILKEEQHQVDYNVTRCKYAEMYKQMGLSDIGHILSCGRDGTFCTGYNPQIKLERSQTIMQGASHCDFRYKYELEE